MDANCRRKDEKRLPIFWKHRLQQLPLADTLRPPESQNRANRQAILDARAKYPDCSLADLYDELTMPVELRKARKGFL